MEELEHCLEAAHLILNVVHDKVREIDDNYKKSIKSSVGLMLYLIAKLDNVQSFQNATEDLAQTKSEMKNHALETISEVLKNWILLGKLGPGFGYGVYSPKPELEVNDSHIHVQYNFSIN